MCRKLETTKYRERKKEKWQKKKWCMRWALMAGFFSEGLGLDQFGSTAHSEANRAAHKFTFLPGSALMWLSSPSPTRPACNAHCKPTRVKLHI